MISSAGIMSIRPQHVKPGQTKASYTYAPRLSEGDSAGYQAIANSLDSTAAVIAQRYIKWLDTKAALEASDAQARFQQRASEIWLGKQVEEVQADGSTKPVYQPGFAHTESRAAVEGYNSYESAIRQAWQETGASLGAAAQKKYFTSSLYLMTNMLNQGRQHAAMAMKQWDQEVLNRDKQVISKGVGDLLTAGDLTRVKAYFDDQFEQFVAKHPIMDSSKAEAFKQQVIKGTAAYLATQPAASGKLQTFKKLMEQDIDLDTRNYINVQYMRAVKREQAERDRAEARAEREQARLIRDNSIKWMAHLLDEKNPWLPTVETAKEAYLNHQISTSVYRYVVERHKQGTGIELSPEQMYGLKQQLLSGASPDDLDIPLSKIKRSQANTLFNFSISLQSNQARQDINLGIKSIDQMANLFRATQGYNVPTPVVVQKFEDIYMSKVQATGGKEPVDIQGVVNQAFKELGYNPDKITAGFRPLPVKLPKIESDAAKTVLGETGYTIVPSQKGLTVSFDDPAVLYETWNYYTTLHKNGKISDKEFLSLNNNIMRWYNYFSARGLWPAKLGGPDGSEPKTGLAAINARVGD